MHSSFPPFMLHVRLGNNSRSFIKPDTAQVQKKLRGLSP
jgi:hypothetical protein